MTINDQQRSVNMVKNTLESVTTQILESSERKNDAIVPISKISMAGDGRILLDGKQSAFSHDIDPFALNQLGYRLGIPANYIQRCPTELRAENVNHWLEEFNKQEAAKTEEESKGKEWFVRFLDGKIRALLSDRYAVLDNKMVMDAVPQAITSKYEVEHFHHVDESDMRLRLVFPDLKAKIGETRLGSDDILQVGIEIRNSERGTGAVRIDQVVYRLVCTNGMMGMATDSVFSKRHMFTNQGDLQMQISNSIKGLLAEGMGTIHQFAAAKDRELATPIEMITKLAKDQKYSIKLIEQIVDAYNFEPDANVFGVVNAFTRAARALPIDKRIEVEEYAGRILQMKALSA